MVHRILRNMIVVTVMIVTASVLAACDNTIRGIGRDIREAGDAIEDATR